MFYRSIRMLENGIKPAYVFDGAPPDLKAAELEKRTERRAEAQKELDKAVEQGDSKAIEKFERRLVKVTKEQNEQVKRLLRAMGIPVIEAPCEAVSSNLINALLIKQFKGSSMCRTCSQAKSLCCSYRRYGRTHFWFNHSPSSFDFQ